MSDNLDEILNRKQTPEEKAAEQAKWRRESVLNEAVKLVTAPTYSGSVGANSVILVAQEFVKFIEGEDK